MEKTEASRRGTASRAKTAILLIVTLVPALLTSCDSAPPGNKSASVHEARQPTPPAPDMLSDDRETSAESYSTIDENPFVAVAENPLSTFSIDVDTASYSNMRRFLNDGQLPPKDAIRIEELVNYFPYEYPQPLGDAPFAVVTDVADCPWSPDHRLVQIGLQGRRIQAEDTPPRNLVFLVDVSGSMKAANKLPLLKSALAMLAEQLTARDRVAIVVYAGAAGLELPATPGDRKSDIIAALSNLEAGGSTAGGQGIALAYRVAEENYIRGGVNRVILATDGDFNVGITNESDLVRLIEAKRGGGVFLTVLGFGEGNLKDSAMEKLADHGNGNYAYIDSLEEARKVLGEQVGGTLVTIAKDVMILFEFNPEEASAYRLIGYENRALANRDFNDDTKDAGEIGAGHTVTALYEIVPPGQSEERGSVDELRYQERGASVAARTSGELMTVKLRYKEPNGQASMLVSTTLIDHGKRLREASDSFRFAASVACFGLVLRDSKYKGRATLDEVIGLATAAKGVDLDGHRTEFLQLVGRAQALMRDDTHVVIR